jgi:hypothetical protein
MTGLNNDFVARSSSAQPREMSCAEPLGVKGQRATEQDSALTGRASRELRERPAGLRLVRLRAGSRDP